MLQTVTILHHTTDGSLAALLGAAQRFVFECGDTTSLVAWTGVLTNGFSVREEVVLEIINHRDRLIEQLWCLTTVHENSLCAKHLRNLGQDARATLSYQPVGELAD